MNYNKKIRNNLVGLTTLLILITSLTLISYPTKAYTPNIEEVFNTEFDQYYTDFLNLVGGDTNMSCVMALINDTEVVHMKGYGEQVIE